MKSSHICAALALSFGVLLQPQAADAHFALGDPLPGGVNYRAAVNFHNLTSTFTDSYHVGAWSWDDPEFGEENAGWTHTSAWYIIKLDVAGTFNLTIERQEGVPWAGGVEGVASVTSMFPSFSFYQGTDNDDSNTHTYTHNGNISWAEDLTYMSHLDNSTETMITASFELPAGSYTLALGSNAATNIPEEQGYKATFQVVPEPSSALLALVTAATLLARRRRAIRE
jgi:hypothetical protein